MKHSTLHAKHRTYSCAFVKQGNMANRVTLDIDIECGRVY